MIFSLVFLKVLDVALHAHFVSEGDNLHEVSGSCFWERTVCRMLNLPIAWWMSIIL